MKCKLIGRCLMCGQGTTINSGYYDTDNPLGFANPCAKHGARTVTIRCCIHGRHAIEDCKILKYHLPFVILPTWLKRTINFSGYTNVNAAGYTRHLRINGIKL